MPMIDLSFSAGALPESQLKALLQPVEATLKRYEEGLAGLRTTRIQQYRA